MNNIFNMHFDNIAFKKNKDETLNAIGESAILDEYGNKCGVCEMTIPKCYFDDKENLVCMESK